MHWKTAKLIFSRIPLRAEMWLGISQIVKVPSRGSNGKIRWYETAVTFDKEFIVESLLQQVLKLKPLSPDKIDSLLTSVLVRYTSAIANEINGDNNNDDEPTLPPQ